MFIHETETWPHFSWDEKIVNELLLRCMRELGYLAGRMAAIGMGSRLVAMVEAYTHDVVASSEIEGISLDTQEVRSSVARKLGVVIKESKDPSHYVDGVVEMMMDATRGPSRALTEERLFGWHKALFPYKTDISVGAFRTDEMTVVSGAYGRERVHYRAPAPEKVAGEMMQFLEWMNNPDASSGIVKSAIAHLWFVSIHPFDDGNGRIARAISDMVLADLDGEELHFYSLSRQILKDKSHYYKVLERTQRGNGEITEWLEWYLKAFISAVEDSSAMLSGVLRKARFWNTHSQVAMSERQRMVLNKYLDGYEAKLTAKNWEKIAGVSKDTALRDISALVQKGVLSPTPGRVRDVSYSINYNKPDADGTPFTAIKVEESGKDFFITCVFNLTRQVRDKLSAIDKQRLDEGEVTLTQLANKYFAYLLAD